MRRAPTPDYYGTTSNQVSEADLRQEFIDTLEGNYPEIPKGRLVLLRKFRRDSSNTLIDCACVDADTGEPDKERFCPISLGEKYLWDETYILSYKEFLIDNFGAARGAYTQAAGHMDIPVVAWYMRYDVDITDDDKIVEVGLDLEGEVEFPVTRTAVWRINELAVMRGDNGRIEYIKALCSREMQRWLSAPTS